MRKGLFAASVVVALIGSQAGVALATGIGDTGPGCGLGKEIWKNESNTDTIGKQLFISTTNNPIIPLQAGGITSGTWGCKNNGKLWTEQKATMFAKVNFESLAQEMAQGQGEHLASLATLMGVPVEHQGDFFALTQERHANLVKAGEDSPVTLVAALNDAIATHPVLSQVVVR
ncbi:MAG: DUF3015 family protein [Nitrospirae bacterium]|nr:DUF3015 family protein [Nitrospirota bacterium]